ncbi:transposase [Leptospira alstonii]
MFKIIILLQKLYNLSDHQAEYQINDQFSFQRLYDNERQCSRFSSPYQIDGNDTKRRTDLRRFLISDSNRFA